MIRSVLPSRSFTSLLCGLVLVFSTAAQVPTQCLEIESILVDACNPASACPGSSEGQNEMVRFRTGPNPIALSDLEADWPNGTWRGIVQNATTAAITAQLNATISSCGELLEPPGGIIPPGSTVLLVTSTEMCVAGNSFSGLSDTIYIIFQDAGNTAGHFANSPAAGQPVSPTPPTGTSIRTLILFDNATNCSDTVSYVRELLVNNQGTYGGMNGESDGSTVVYSWPGPAEATYVNYGCQAPFDPLFVQTDVDGALCGGIGTVNITGQVIGGTFTSVQWQGGTGTFGDPTTLNTTYTAGAGDLATVVLTLCAQTDCADPICGTLNIPAGSGPIITIVPDGPLGLCPGEDVMLTATGADSYVWGGGEITNSITVNTIGTYSVTGTNACGSLSGSITVTTGSGVIVTITGNTQICPGESTVLTASGAAQYIWSTGEFSPSIVVSAPGSYSVTGSNSCGSSTEAITVTQAPGPIVSIAGNLSICEGESTVLTASGATSYTWNTQATSPSITVTTAGTYTVTGSNGCGAAQATATLAVGPLPVVVISGSTAICAGASTTLTASGADSYAWSTGATDPSIIVGSAGTISVTGTNSCGTDVAEVEVLEGVAPTVQVTGNGVLCPGGQVVLTAVSTAPVSWNTGATSNTLTVTTAGLYIATATNGCGSDSDGATVTASALDAAFSATPTSGTAPLVVSFNNTTTPVESSSDWDFDDGTTSTSTSPSHTFDVPGTYVVELTAMSDGCAETTTAVITVLPVQPGNTSSISIPNVFTPNEDRHNDLLLVNAVNISQLEVLIYNRWGQKVNELKRIGEAWDGRSMAGEVVPDGTYFYTLDARGIDGQQFSLSGHITLVR
jgi:gliding motility-associated-like protein